MIDYQNITDNEIRRIVSQAADPSAQVKILRDLTGKTIPYIKRAAGIKLSAEDKLIEENGKRWGWREADIEFLKDNPRMPLKELAANLGKDVSVIERKRRQLGINLKVNWTKKEINRLIKLYKQDLKKCDIATKLGKTPGSIKYQLRRLREKGIID